MINYFLTKLSKNYNLTVALYWLNAYQQTQEMLNSNNNPENQNRWKSVKRQ